MSNKSKPIVVFDTGCVLQAALNPVGPAAFAIDVMIQGRIDVYTSPQLRSEYEEVLYRPAIRAKYPHITDAQVVAGLALFDDIAVMISNPPHYLKYDRDPNDEHVINLAIHVDADYIVTRDKDLLDLMDKRRPDGQFFRNRFPNISILAPVEFLQVIGDDGKR